EFVRHEHVQAAVIGGHGRAKPMLLLELVPETEGKVDKEGLLQSLAPYLEKVNALCHESVQLSPELILITNSEKPLVRTLKGSVARLPSLQHYEDEITELYGRLQ